MNQPEIEFDHIGLAVETLEKARPFWTLLGWEAQTKLETVTDQKVTVDMLPLKNHSNIELLEATDEESPIAKFVAKRGPGIHHICLRVKSLDKLLEKLKKNKIRLINETPVIGAHGKRVAFIHPSSTGGVLVELSEKV